MSGVDGTALERYLTETADARLESYRALLRIPSISTLPEHAADCRAAAEWIAADLASSGIEHVEVSETAGHPVVYGDWLHAGPDAPTFSVITSPNPKQKRALELIQQIQL